MEKRIGAQTNNPYGGIKINKCMKEADLLLEIEPK